MQRCMHACTAMHRRANIVVHVVKRWVAVSHRLCVSPLPHARCVRRTAHLELIDYARMCATPHGVVGMQGNKVALGDERLLIRRIRPLAR